MENTNSSDRKTFATAVVNEFEALKRMSHWYAADPMDAEDLAQDTCVLALRFFETYEQGSNLRAWLFRIMRNRYVSIGRRRSLEKRVFESEERHALAEWSVGEMGRRTMERGGGVDVDKGFSDPVLRAMQDLSPEFRDAVWMCDVEGLSYAEAADRTSRPIGTIMSRLHRGRMALKRKLVSCRELEAA